MDIYENPGDWSGLLRRPSQDNPEVMERVRAILEKVRTEGDAALASLSREIEGRELAIRPGDAGLPLCVPEETIRRSQSLVSDEVKAPIRTAAANIRAFHSAQLPHEIAVETSPGVRCIQRPVPIGRVGLYIPGGTAPLFSTVLMLAIPASVAGCRDVVLCTPAGPSGAISPEVLYAAQYCGISRIFCIGGAQAIAAMAYGTETVPRVDKIFGPGNGYVTAAKQLLSAGTVAIDMPAGPSEVMVIADGTSDPAIVASDLLSQAEHGRDSQVMLLCGDRTFAEKTLAEVNRQLELLPRASLASSALGHSRAVVLAGRDRMVAFANAYAPEHLIISASDPWYFADRVTTAGSVFVGPWTPESAGDYASGTNHTLPTCGWARSFSGVNVDSFMRKMTIQEISRDGLQGLAPTITAMSRAEGLEAHAQAVDVRLGPASESLSSLRQRTIGDVMSLVRGNIALMAPYSTARDEFTGSIGVFLDANESPYPTGWNRYPDPRQKALKARISEIKGVDADNIFIGNGSDEAIDLVYRIFCEPGRDNALVIAPSYGMYTVAADTNDVQVRTVPLGSDFSLPHAEIARLTDSRSKLLFVCSPNNPSGNAFSQEEIVVLLRSFPGVVVLDEAYVDFSSKGSMLPRLREFPNLIILQTLSKAYGLAGLRLGLAYAAEPIASLMGRVKYPYNINQAAQDLVLEALKKPVDACVAEILSERRRLERILPEFSSVRKVWPSDANFLLVEFDDADAVYDHLLTDGIIVRNRNRVCPGCLRLTVGLPEENDLLLESLGRYKN